MPGGPRTSGAQARAARWENKSLECVDACYARRRGTWAAHASSSRPARRAAASECATGTGECCEGEPPPTHCSHRPGGAASVVRIGAATERAEWSQHFEKPSWEVPLICDEQEQAFGAGPPKGLGCKNDDDYGVDVKKSVRALLNKLCPGSSEKSGNKTEIRSQLQKIPLANATELGEIADVMMQQAIHWAMNDNPYIGVLAELICDVSLHYPSFPPDHDAATPGGGPRELRLTDHISRCCQAEFAQLYSDLLEPGDGHRAPAGCAGREADSFYKRKDRTKGFIGILGPFCEKRVLPTKALPEVMCVLLRGPSSGTSPHPFEWVRMPEPAARPARHRVQPLSEFVESACMLLNTTQHLDWGEKVYDRLRRLKRDAGHAGGKKDSVYPARICFMIDNVLEKYASSSCTSSSLSSSSSARGATAESAQPRRSKARSSTVSAGGGTRSAAPSGRARDTSLPWRTGHTPGTRLENVAAVQPACRTVPVR